MKRRDESTYRSVIKAITFRIIVITADSIILLVLTRRVDVTVGVIILSNLSSTIFYIVHERMWNRIRWGIHASR